MKRKDFFYVYGVLLTAGLLDNLVIKLKFHGEYNGNFVAYTVLKL